MFYISLVVILCLYLLLNAIYQIGKGVRQGCVLSPYFFNLYAEHIMSNAGLEEAQTGNKIAGRNINDLYLMAESEEEVKAS